MINLDDAFTKQIRSYHESMKGIVGTASPYSAKVGVVRQLSYDPKVLNTRGFLDPNSDTANGNTNIYCPTELLNSFTPLHADPARVA